MVITKRKKSDDLEAKLAETEQRWKRALADYQNLEKRTMERQRSMTQLSSLLMLEKLLPLLDNLTLAANHLNDPGLAMVIKQFNDILSAEGVTEIDTVNKPFDPQKMECIEQVEGEKDFVVTELNKGYLLGDQVMRAAKVTVGKGLHK